MGAIALAASIYEWPPFHPETHVQTLTEKLGPGNVSLLTPLKQEWLNTTHQFKLEYAGCMIGRPDRSTPSNIWMEEVTLVKLSGVSPDGQTRFPVSREAVAGIQSIQIPGWSPDGEWLVMPAGLYKGYIAYKASELPGALSHVETQSKSYGVRVATGDSDKPAQAWHRFLHWVDGNRFQFQAGKLGSAQRFYRGLCATFECDLRTGTVSWVSTALPDFAISSPQAEKSK